MKNRILFLAFCCCSVLVNAQYCGLSGGQVCSPSLVDTSLNWQPVESNFLCIERGVPFNQSISFYLRTYSIYFTGQYQDLQVQSIHVISIDTLPSGMCWATNKTSDYAVYGDTICISFQGVTFDTAGDYTLSINAIFVSNAPQFEPVPSVFHLRVIDAGTQCLTTSGIEDPGNSRVTISLNQLHISCDVGAITGVNIYSATGSLVRHFQLTHNNSIDISSLAQGLYIAEIVTAEGTLKKKWVRM